MHVPVLLHEAVAALDPRPGGIYMDCTFGRGGHAAELLPRIGETGRLLVLDRDPEAVAAARALAAGDRRVEVADASFDRVAEVARAAGVFGRVDGVLFDLGLSSAQLDDAMRGFGFQSGSLDMRMDPRRGESAAQWLAHADVGEIAEVLHRLGEERHARRIARALVAARAAAPLTSAAQLAEVIARAVPTRERKKHPATRSFQAIRIHVNRELECLREALDVLPPLLRAGGRIAIISFHSLEDRMVKRFMRPPPTPRALAHLPIPGAPLRDWPVRALGTAQRPREEEIRRNPRARSAVLRVAEVCR